MKQFLACALLAALLCSSGQVRGAEATEDKCCAPIVFTTDAQFCADISRAAAEMKARGPVALDPVTQDDGVEVDCARKTVEYPRSVSVTTARMKPGWQEGKTAQWQDSACKSDLLVAAMNHGWVLSITVTFADREQFHYIVECPKSPAKKD